MALCCGIKQNNGVIALTNVASRQAGYAGAFWLFLFGLIGKFGGVVLSIPSCVLGGATSFLFASVLVAGIKVRQAMVLLPAESGGLNGCGDFAMFFRRVSGREHSAVALHCGLSSPLTGCYTAAVAVHARDFLLGWSDIARDSRTMAAVKLPTALIDMKGRHHATPLHYQPKPAALSAAADSDAW